MEMKNNYLNTGSLRWQTELDREDPMLVPPTESTDERLNLNSDSTDRSSSSARPKCNAPHQIRHQLSNEKSHRDDVLGLDDETKWLYTMQRLQRDISQVSGCGSVALPPEIHV